MSHFMKSSKAPWFIPMALSLFLAACGPATEFYRNVDTSVAGHDFAAAIADVRAHQGDYGE